MRKKCTSKVCYSWVVTFVFSLIISTWNTVSKVTKVTSFLFHPFRVVVWLTCNPARFICHSLHSILSSLSFPSPWLIFLFVWLLRTLSYFLEMPHLVTHSVHLFSTSFSISITTISQSVPACYFIFLVSVSFSYVFICQLIFIVCWTL